jgi:FtsZ-binding cell division protein ZapB
LTQKDVNQFRAEKNAVIEEKMHYLQDIEEYKKRYLELETSLLEKIKKIQDAATIDKNNYVNEQQSRIKELQDNHEKQMIIIKSECNSNIIDKEKQIEALINHIKSYSDNQHIVLNEMEKIKLINEKLKTDTFGIDQKINEIHLYYKKEIEDLKILHKKEKELLIDSYNENIKKSQELNEALQIRLNQTIEALSLSKTAISNLKETNISLEKQVQSRDSEEITYQDKYQQLRSENYSLREKLDRSIELNNVFSTKEKQYESQLRQLQSKYAQLITLTKKGINN